MIPGRIPSSSRGEEQLFNKLLQDKGAAEWVVFHSLEIREHRSKLEGEIDMIVVVPDHGILCIEVKACPVSRQDGMWIYPYANSPEGPFRQASRAMHSLRDYIDARDQCLKGLLYMSAVIFTNSDFEELSPEWHRWQYLNKKDFTRNSISHSIKKILERAHNHVREKTGIGSWYDSVRSRPTLKQTERITKILRNNFEYTVSPRDDIEHAEQSILHFTEEQFDALDHMIENPRVIFKGPAGTGKTFLAAEAAKRAATSGKRVLLLCFNKLLGSWLANVTSDVAGAGTSFRCMTFHSLMLELSGSGVPLGASSSFWQHDLPAAALEALFTKSGNQYEFDLLLIDEAQDLLRDEYLDILDFLLKGGLAAGNWAIFGDFENQSIYLQSSEPNDISEPGSGLDRLLERVPSPPRLTLSVNCRNAEKIAETVMIVSDLQPRYKRSLNILPEASVDPIFFRNSSDQSVKLSETITVLLKRFLPSEIVVLSLRADLCSAASELSKARKDLNIKPFSTSATNAVRYASVYAFKGMEAAAIVITDIDSLVGERAKALLYIGMSRARVTLYMFMDEKCRGPYNDVVRTTFLKRTRL